jgi:hypothetical protein
LPFAAGQGNSVQSGCFGIGYCRAQRRQNKRNALPFPKAAAPRNLPRRQAGICRKSRLDDGKVQPACGRQAHRNITTNCSDVSVRCTLMSDRIIDTTNINGALHLLKMLAFFYSFTYTKCREIYFFI